VYLTYNCVCVASAIITQSNNKEMKSSAIRRHSPSSAAVSPPAADTTSNDYSKPTIQYHDVTAAAYRIRKGVKETPLEVHTCMSVVCILLWRAFLIVSWIHNYMYRNIH
jgi:hypothetical protein